MKLQEIIRQLEQLAPPYWQESYDNAGLLTGSASMDITGILICLDSTEAVLEEAMQKNCNLVIAHHPILFSGLKRITGKTYVERTLIKAIKNDIAIYAIHTNLDNVAHGVNSKIADRLGLKDTVILQPRENSLSKLVTFAPHAAAESVRSALFAAGAGTIGNYGECSFNVEGTGTFKAGKGAQPYVGDVGQRHEERETRIEVIYEAFREVALITALKAAHPYEEVAYFSSRLTHAHPNVGSGMIGNLTEKMSPIEFFNLLKNKMLCRVIRHTTLTTKTVERIAVCGGSGSFLLDAAKAAGADVFVTSDYKYHQFFDADGALIIADIGHYESEQFTGELISDYLKDKFATFAVHLSEVNTNPVNYF